LAIERNFQQQRFALWDGDKKKQQEIQNAIDLSYRQGSLIATKAVTDGLKAQEAQYKQIFTQIGSAITSNVIDVLKGTETITQGFQKMYQGLVTSLLDYFAKKAEKMAEDWLLEQIFGKQKAAANVGQATSNVAVAGTEALASVPWPFNIAAAAETEGVGTGLIAEAGVAFYALGGIVPQDGLAYLHKNEKVIPASMSGKGDGLGGSGVTVVVNHSVSAVDAASFQGHIRRHGNMIANEVTRALKRKGVR
jgi:P2-related tail formation protein